MVVYIVGIEDRNYDTVAIPFSFMCTAIEYAREWVKKLSKDGSFVEMQSFKEYLFYANYMGAMGGSGRLDCVWVTVQVVDATPEEPFKL